MGITTRPAVLGKNLLHVNWTGIGISKFEAIKSDLREQIPGKSFKKKERKKKGVEELDLFFRCLRVCDAPAEDARRAGARGSLWAAIMGWPPPLPQLIEWSFMVDLA